MNIKAHIARSIDWLKIKKKSNVSNRRIRPKKIIKNHNGIKIIIQQLWTGAFQPIQKYVKNMLGDNQS